MSENTNPSASTEIPPFEIRDTNISAADVEALMQQIRDRIRNRSQQAENQGRSYHLPNSMSAGKRLPGTLYGSMERLRAASSAVSVHLSVVGQHQLPIIGTLLQKVRRALHQLILYYVSMLAGRQSAFNRASIDMNRQTILALEAAIARIEKLEQEVALLRMQGSASTGTSENA